MLTTLTTLLDSVLKPAYTQERAKGTNLGLARSAKVFGLGGWFPRLTTPHSDFYVLCIAVT